MKNSILTIAATILLAGTFMFATTSTTSNKAKSCCYKGSPCCFKGSSCCK